MALHCIHCRSEIDPHYKACPFCGEAVTGFLPGAPLPPSPEAAETDGATYEVPHLDPNAPTVVTRSASDIAETVPATVIVTPRGRVRFAGIAATAAFVLIVAIGAIGTFNRPQAKPPVQRIGKPAQASMVVSAPGRLAINAFPWANVTSIRNLNTGAPIELDGPVVTPAPPIDLSPGRYEITLSNPGFKDAITRVVDIGAGQDAMLNVQFANPATARLPLFDGRTE